MSLAQVCLAFLLQIALGSLLSLRLTDRDALGPKYFKFAGWLLVGFYGLAATLIVPGALAAEATQLQALTAGCVLLAAVGMLAFASVSGWDRPGLERLCFGVTLLAGAAGVVASTLSGLPADADSLLTTLALLVAAASSLVLGFTTWGMILGHWYLTDHSLDLIHLRRLVRPLPWIFVVQLLASGLSMTLLWERFLGPGNASLDALLQRQPERVLDVVNLWARLPVGALVPLIMSWMTLETVRLKKTQPATGILYAMCVTVYMGDLMGKMVQGATGVPW